MLPRREKPTETAVHANGFQDGVPEDPGKGQNGTGAKPDQVMDWILLDAVGDHRLETGRFNGGGAVLKGWDLAGEHQDDDAHEDEIHVEHIEHVDWQTVLVGFGIGLQVGVMLWTIAAESWHVSKK